MKNPMPTGLSISSGDAMIDDRVLPTEEDLHFDFKRAGRNDSAIETLCAFANTEGGWLGQEKSRPCFLSCRENRTTMTCNCLTSKSCARKLFSRRPAR